MTPQEIIKLILDRLANYGHRSAEEEFMERLRSEHNLTLDDIYRALNFINGDE